MEKVNLDHLYNSRFENDPDKQFKVDIRFKEKKHLYALVLQGGDKKPDCKISSFEDNIWFRTPNGENSVRYQRLGSLVNAIKRTSLKYGLTFEELVITKGFPNVL